MLLKSYVTMLRTIIFLFLLNSMKCENYDVNGTSEMFKKKWSFIGTAYQSVRPCIDNNFLSAGFESRLPPEDQNKYTLTINEKLPSFSRMSMVFDSEAIVELGNNKTGTISNAGELRVFVNFYRETDTIVLRIRGPPYRGVPYPKSIEINGVEYCEKPNIGFMDWTLNDYFDVAHVALATPDLSCGRRMVLHTELIVNGQPTSPGDWPWHAALYRLEKSGVQYVCGGTLISKNFVLTAAHCATINGVATLPDVMSVVLGKYNLFGGDLASQERRVQDIIVHEEYYQRFLHNDIALLKLKTKAIFDDYVQPACLSKGNSFKNLASGIIYGNVVGWGFNHTNQLSSVLHQVLLPVITDATCIKTKPDFFGKILNNRKFCAGYRNGTSACNGDSGGGFMVFVPDDPNETGSNATGSYHVHGIVSLALKRPDAALCDPTQYSIFTNVRNFVPWIEENIKSL